MQYMSARTPDASLCEAHCFSGGLALSHTSLKPYLFTSPLTTINLAPSLFLPHAIRDCNHRRAASLDWECVRSGDRVGVLNVVSLDLDLLVSLGLLNALFRWYVDDVARDFQRASFHLGYRKLGLAILNKLDVSARAEFAQLKVLSPVNQIFPQSRWFYAQLFQLGRRQGEESLPGRELGRMLAHATADEGKKGLDIGYEWGR